MLKHFFKRGRGGLLTSSSGAHGSVVMCVRPVTERLLAQTPLWSRYPAVVTLCCVLSTLSTLSQSTQLKLDNGISWELNCNGLVSDPGGMYL